MQTALQFCRLSLGDTDGDHWWYHVLHGSKAFVFFHGSKAFGMVVKPLAYKLNLPHWQARASIHCYTGKQQCIRIYAAHKLQHWPNCFNTNLNIDIRSKTECDLGTEQRFAYMEDAQNYSKCYSGC